MPGGILALDLCSTVGHAYGQIDDRGPISGTWRLASLGLGAMIASFENELEDMLVLHRPALIFVEAPLTPTAISNTTVWRQQLGLAGAAECASYRHSIRYAEQSASTVRSQILGTTRHPKGGTIKDVVLAYCRKQGWDPCDHNAGDACVLWEFARREAQNRRRSFA